MLFVPLLLLTIRKKFFSFSKCFFGEGARRAALLTPFVPPKRTISPLNRGNRGVYDRSP